MTEKRASELISENLTAIYGYAFARLYDKDKVEDLASEIVYEIIVSAKNLKNDEAFWSFAWKIAENTFRKFIRREEIAGAVQELDDQSFVGVYENSPETEYIEAEEQNEQIYLLRRELSMLTKTHREVCVAYYVDNKSCSEIAKEFKISAEMVKYHLFKTRKLLKEGIGMARIYGEKSYNPGVFRINFMGDRNLYYDIFTRKLPGAIVLAAYYTPMTAEELSMEVGVSMPYLEEELEILESAGVLLKTGTKYRTNLVIITEAYEKEVELKTKDIYPAYAQAVWEKAKNVLCEIRKLDFHGKDYDDNRLLFAIINMAMVEAYGKAMERADLGNAPKLPLGNRGRIWGHDNDFKNLRFHGVCMEVWNKEHNAWFSAENYRVIEKAQRYDHSNFSEKTEAICDAVLEREPDRFNKALSWLIENKFILSENGRLSANFPVFDADAYDKVCEIIGGVVESACECMAAVTGKATEILSEHVPKNVKDQCAAIANVHHNLDVAAILMEMLIEHGRLTVPDEKVPLCVFGVKK